MSGFGPYGGFQGMRRRVRVGGGPPSLPNIPGLTFFDFSDKSTITLGTPPDVDSVAAVSGTTAPTLNGGTTEPHNVAAGIEFAASVTDSLVSAASAATFRPWNETAGSVWVVTSNDANSATLFDNCRINLFNVGTFMEITGAGLLNAGVTDGAGGYVFNVFSGGIGTSASPRLFEMHWDSSAASLLVDGVEVDTATGPFTMAASDPADMLHIGLRSNGVTNPLDGTAESLAYLVGTTASAGGKTAMRTYLTTKYGL